MCSQSQVDISKLSSKTSSSQRNNEQQCQQNQSQFEEDNNEYDIDLSDLQIPSQLPTENKIDIPTNKIYSTKTNIGNQGALGGSQDDPDCNLSSEDQNDLDFDSIQFKNASTKVDDFPIDEYRQESGCLNSQLPPDFYSSPLKDLVQQPANLLKHGRIVFMKTKTTVGSQIKQDRVAHKMKVLTSHGLGQSLKYRQNNQAQKGNTQQIRDLPSNLEVGQIPHHSQRPPSSLMCIPGRPMLTQHDSSSQNLQIEQNGNQDSRSASTSNLNQIIEKSSFFRKVTLGTTSQNYYYRRDNSSLMASGQHGNDSGLVAKCWLDRASQQKSCGQPNNRGSEDQMMNEYQVPNGQNPIFRMIPGKQKSAMRDRPGSVQALMGPMATKDRGQAEQQQQSPKGDCQHTEMVGNSNIPKSSCAQSRRQMIVDLRHYSNYSPYSQGSSHCKKQDNQQAKIPQIPLMNTVRWQ